MTSRSRESPASLLLPERPFDHYSLIGNRQTGTGIDEDYDGEMEQIQRDIPEEGMEFGENMQRSEDEGWLYPDDDAGVVIETRLVAQEADDLTRLEFSGEPLLARITRRSAENLKIRPGLALKAQIKAVALLAGTAYSAQGCRTTLAIAMKGF
jgi:hypothetical protein